MAIFKVIKRNWAIVDFARSKIENALKLAIEACGGTDFSKLSDLTDSIITDVERKVWKNIPSVEEIQDSVEDVLIKWWHDTVAKAYIKYREKRNEARKWKDVVVEVQKTMQEYLDNLDWRINENANIWYSIWWLILKNSEKITANYRLSSIYPEEIWNAHRNGDYHIHDLGMFTPYCEWWSLRALLEEWFNGVQWKLQSAPPKNLQSAVNQMINFLWTLQNEWAWAQAFSSFDTYLAPFVHKRREEVENQLNEVNAHFDSEQARHDYIYNNVYKYVKQQMQNFIFGLNVPSRWWTQTPFTNITLDWVCPPDLRDKALMLGWLKYGPYKKKFGELQEEMKMINKVLIEVYTEWDHAWSVFTFPIPTYNIVEDFPWDDPLVDDLFEMTAKYWLPYFQNFIGSQFEKDANGRITTTRKEWAYSPSAVRSMCCRLQLDLKQLEKRGWGLFGSAEMTWSIWVVTINAARIWYNFKWDKEWFKKQLKYLMNLAKMSLELKRKEMTKWLDAWLYPYTKRYLNSFRNHFSTIWVNGLNEAVLNFTNWKDDISTKEWREFAKEILDFMRAILVEYQEETWNLYNLEATPAEWTTYRFAKEDQKQLKWIIQAGTPEAPYYTNSSQLPVWFTDDVFEAMDLQDELQCKYTWGTVLHLYMWERMSSDACKALVKKAISNYQMPYISISPTFSICPKHGYIPWEHDFCPLCDQEIGYTGEKYDMEMRKKYTADPEKLDKIRRDQSIAED